MKISVLFQGVLLVSMVALMVPACSSNDRSQTPSLPNAALRGAPQGGFTFVTSDGRLVPYMPTRRQAARFAPYFKLPLTFALTYGGGSIQPSPKVYVVFWGKIWQNRIGDPDGVGRYLKDFLKALNGSQWLSTVTQYYGPPGTYITNTTSLQGTYIDSTSELPPQPSDEIIRYEAYLAAAHFGDYSGDASYVVAMPHGHDPPWFGFGLCAYHASLSNAGPSGQPIAYTALPYMPDTGKACGAGSVNNPGTLDGVSIIEGHEQAETETDPQPFTGWSGANHFELADPCDWHNLQNTQFGRKTFPTQPLWSNVDNGCVQ